MIGFLLLVALETAWIILVVQIVLLPRRMREVKEAERRLRCIQDYHKRHAA